MPSRRNGAAAIDVRRRPIRTATITLNGDYQGTEATVRLNPPLRVYDEFSTDVRKALGQVVLAWNLVDDDGKAVGLDETLSGATDEELAAIGSAYMDALKNRVTLPNSVATPSGTGGPTST